MEGMAEAEDRSQHAGSSDLPRISEAAGPACDLCGAAMIDFNCELICLNCGFRRDCSDP